MHESVRAELNARRRGTHATKTRGNVRGGGAKPWRQKGTGRARAGSSRSPIWVGGGTIFGPSPRKYTFKVNRKERRAALRSALSVHADRGSIAVFDPAPFDTPSTKSAAGAAGRLRPRRADADRARPTRRSARRCRFATSSASRCCRCRWSASPTSSARPPSCCSQEALDALTARAKGEAPEPERRAQEAEA